MTREITATISKIVFTASLLCFISMANAEELYQWKDADGTITFSTTPPPADITTKFQEISKTFKAETPKIQAATADAIAAKPAEPANKSIADPIEVPIRKSESKLERLVRLSPEPPKPTQPQIEESVLQPVNQDKVRKQRKCRDLSFRVEALESRLRNVNSAKELNDSILLLTKYQNSFDKYCEQY